MTVCCCCLIEALAGAREREKIVYGITVYSCCLVEAVAGAR